MLPGLANAPLHPLLVHFPIVLWLAALVVSALALRRDGAQLWPAARWLLVASTLAALAAAASGLWASDQLGHDSPGHDLVHVHRNYMLVAGALGVLATVIVWLKRIDPSKGLRVGVVALLAATVAVTAVGADRGVELVYRYGVGVKGELPPEGAPHSHGEEGDDHQSGDDHHGASDDHHGASDDPPSNESGAAPQESVKPTEPTASPVEKEKPPAREHQHPAGHEHVH